MEDTKEQSLKMQEKRKIFFPNLDGLRFFSFLIVFFSHIFSTDKDYIKNESWYKFFKGRLFSDGDLGVSFFFVLSGFLITYLLLKEKEYTKRIDISSFANGVYTIELKTSDINCSKRLEILKVDPRK